MQKKYILVINAGSSSIKFKLYESQKFDLILSGICERIRVDGYFKISFLKNKEWITLEENANFSNHKDAIEHFLKRIEEQKVINSIEEIMGVGHRIVQGGPLTESKVINKEVENIIKDCIKLAPLHNEPEYEVIKIIQEEITPNNNVAVFDTSFHANIPKINNYYAIPKDIIEKHKIKKYGFHGTSYQFILERTKKILKINRKLNLIVCHLGNGASICCIKKDVSYDTTMGLTPNAGLIMGTRCGDIDCTIIDYIVKMENTSVAEITKKLNNESGLKGICGDSDFRDINKKAEKSKDHTFALDIFAQKVANYICLYANHLENKIDAIIFTGGIGENDWKIREKILSKIFVINAKINKKNNMKKFEDFLEISEKKSEIKVFAIQTNEELMIAKETKKLLTKN